MKNKLMTRLLPLSIAGAAAVALATTPFGIVLNQTLTKGVAKESISEHLQLNKNPDGTVVPWQMQLQIQGDTDLYTHRLILAPGGHSGWHSHPGVLLGTVVSGQIDGYDARCQKRTFHAGEVFTENDHTHALYNSGTVNADLSLVFVLKSGATRRIDEQAPSCAVSTPVP